MAWVVLARKKSVTLIESRILNDNWVNKSELDRDVVIESTQSDAGLMKASVKLFSIESDLLDQVVEDGSNIRLEVIYSIDGVRKIMEFGLERRVKKHTVFRT